MPHAEKNTESKKKKTSFPEIFQIYKKGMLFWWNLSPAMLLAPLFCALIDAVSPYVTLWISARLLDEIAGAHRPDAMARLALAAALTAAALALASHACGRWRNKHFPEEWNGFKRLFVQKICSMDFARADDPATRALYDEIMQADNWASWGLRKLYQLFPNLITGVFRTAGAVALCVTLFTSRVPQGSRFAWLDTPFVWVGMFAVLLAVILIVPYCSRRSMEYMSRCNEDSTLGNRVFFYYGMAPSGSDRGMDIRTYQQDNIFTVKMSEGCRAFGTNGPFAVYARGPMGGFEALGSALSRSFTGIAYLFVCLKAWVGAFGVGAVTQYVGAITNFAGGLSQFFVTFGQLRVNLPYLQKALNFLELPNEMYQGSLSVEKRRDRNYEVEFRDVSFRYPGSDTWALRHVSFKFRVGQRLAVVGENGSGKTTFIKLLCRLYDPDEGQILLNNIDIRKYDYNQYQAIFSVVFQDFQLLSQPLGQNVAAGSQVDEARAAGCLQKAGLGEWLKHQPKGLATCLYRDFEEDGVNISGGEAQKIAIARALYKNAAFIVLDEPTAALDPIAEAEVYSGFDTLIEDRTAIYISHRLSSCRFCDAIAVFDKGNIVQQGVHESLLAREGKYAALWNAQAQYYT